MKKRKILIPIVSLLAVVFAFAPSFTALALGGPWGPERDTYLWEAPANHAVFNSITNNPGLGDERNFVRIRKVGDAKYQDEVKLEYGQRYEVYAYYHNNATDKPAGAGQLPIGQTGIGIADEVRMSANFPAKIQAGERLAVNAIITARFSDLVDASVPRAVWDGAYITSDDDFYLRYVPGTATIHNGGDLNGQGVGPSYLFSTQGALLGYNKFSGILPGCNQYAGYVTYQFQVDKPDFEMSKKIRVESGELVDSVTVSVGSIVEFVIRYENTGTMQQENVRIQDTLPDGMEYIAGTAVLRNNNDKVGSIVNDDVIGQNGMNIGSYAGVSAGEAGWAELSYKARVKDGNACGAKMRNLVAVITADGTREDSAEIIVNNDDCVPVALPEAGPGEIALAVIAVLSIGVGGTYWYRSQRTLTKVTHVAEGKSDGAK